MSQPDTRSSSPADGTVVEEYVFDVRVVRFEGDDGDTRFRFEAPEHTGVTFPNRDDATLYADAYFDTNGFAEAGTGDRGVPPEVIQAGRDTLAAYFLTMDGTDFNWVASFYGKKPSEIERYVGSVRTRASEIREQVRDERLD